MQVCTVLQRADGAEIRARWEWDLIKKTFGMVGQPTRCWVETEADFLHLVTEWPGDPYEAPAPFGLCHVGGTRESRSVAQFTLAIPAAP